MTRALKEVKYDSATTRKEFIKSHASRKLENRIALNNFIGNKESFKINDLLVIFRSHISEQQNNSKKVVSDN